MSAAEKLKALDGEFDWYEAELSTGEKYRLVPAALVDALPQIVAVVEAAEKMRKDFQRQMDAWDYAEYYVGASGEIAPAFDAALTALDEVLP